MRVCYNVLTLLLYICTVIAGHYIWYKGDHLIQTTMHIRIYMGIQSIWDFTTMAIIQR